MEQIKILLFLMLCIAVIYLMWRMYADSEFICNKNTIDLLVDQRERKDKRIAELNVQIHQFEGICLAKDLKLKQAGEAVDQQVKDLKDKYDITIASQFKILNDELKRRGERIALLYQENEKLSECLSNESKNATIYANDLQFKCQTIIDLEKKLKAKSKPKRKAR